jgi:glucose/arabinose dehydrogenase
MQVPEHNEKEVTKDAPTSPRDIGGPRFMRGPCGRWRGGRKRRELRLLVQRIVRGVESRRRDDERRNHRGDGVDRLERLEQERLRQQRLRPVPHGKLGQLSQHVTGFRTRDKRGLRNPCRGPRRLVATVTIPVVIAVGCGSGEAGKAASIGAGLQGQKGLRATVYATGLKNASAFAFDPQGRLWVTTSAATQHAHDGVYMVNMGGAPVKVVSNIAGPLGLVWHGGKLYVASLGRVDAFSGLRGSHFSKRQTILSGPVAGGENNNLVMAPDGRMLMGVSASCDHCTPTSRFSGAIVSFRQDGSDLRVYASGIRAGYGLAYYPGTSDLFVTMNQRDDLGARTPGDWLAVVRNGDSWGFPGCHGQGGSACTGVPKPTAELDRHAAAGGVAIVTGQLGSGFERSAIVAEWQSRKVERVALTKSGSRYRGSVSTLLTGIKNPLAVTTTPDGAVLVGDWTTGTIYRVARS